MRMIEWRIAGCRVQISCLFFAAAALLLMSDGGTVTVLGLAASLLHEMGHLVAMPLLGCTPTLLCLGIFGMRVEYPQGVRIGYRRAAAISLAGPAVNYLMAGLFFGPFSHAAAGWVHLLLGIFHLLPIDSLDGGQALRSLLLCRISPERAGRVLAVTSAVCLFAVAVLGGAVLWAGGYNFTLLLLAIYLTFLLIFKKKD